MLKDVDARIIACNPGSGTLFLLEKGIEAVGGKLLIVQLDLCERDYYFKDVLVAMLNKRPEGTQHVAFTGTEALNPLEAAMLWELMEAYSKLHLKFYVFLPLSAFGTA